MNATLKTATRGTNTNLDAVKNITANAKHAKVSHAKTKPAAPELPAISSVKLVPLALIDIEPQVRTIFDDASIADLAADIQARGLLQPVLLNPHGNRFTLIAGERRVRACRLAGLSDIPALITKASQADALLMQLAENIQREDLDLQDEVNAIRLLHDNLKTVQAVADTVKKSSAWVSKRLALSHRDFAYIARQLMEDGITEDVEILNTLSQINAISWPAAQQQNKEIREGTATRETVRQALKDLKAATKANDGPRLSPEAKQRQNDEQQKRNQAEQKRALERKEGTGPEFIEAALGRLQNECAEPGEKANEATVYLNSLKEEQRAAILAHLIDIQAKAKKWTLGEWAWMLTPYDSEYTYLEQFAAVMAIKGQTIDSLFALVTILEAANMEVE